MAVTMAPLDNFQAATMPILTADGRRLCPAIVLVVGGGSGDEPIGKLIVVEPLVPWQSRAIPSARACHDCSRTMY
eukprot:5103796-Pyramimonas_sp.AAC.1